MAGAKRLEKNVPIERVYLHHENPRHEPYQSQAEVIDYLCRKEDVPQLARDIATHGLNPLERFALVRDKQASTEGEPVYVVAEGNRRVCAIKLLGDPDLAPGDKRDFFERLSNGADAVLELPSVIFEDEKDLNLWLERTHQGPAGGVGRRPWNAEQKQRHSGGPKNKTAIELLDYAEKKGFITREARQGKLTTVQRYVGNPILRSALGLDISNPDSTQRTRTEQDFDLLVQKFVSDMSGANPKVNSRTRSEDVQAYARELEAVEGQTREQIEPEPLLKEGGTGSGSARRPRPRRGKRPTRLPYEPEIQKQLKRLGSTKLESLYASLCNLPVQDHAPLLTIGLWSFLETLTANMGRSDGTSFDAFLSAERLQLLGLGDRRKTKGIRQTIKRISDSGNTNKHDSKVGTFDSMQLVNDMESLKGVILACIDQAINSLT